MSKPLININVPKAGRITTNRLIGAAVVGGVILAGWNWGSKLPYVGQYVNLGEYYVLSVLGFSGLTKPTIS